MIEEFSNPREILNRAHQLHKEEKFDEAEKLYLSILNSHPEEPSVLFLLGTLYLQQKKHGLAVVLLEGALDVREFAEGYNNLGSALKAENLEDRALKAYQRSIELDPKNADVWNNLATLHVNAGSPEECIKLCDRCIELDPDHPNAHWNRGLANLELEKWELGWEGYEWGFKSKDRMIRFYHRPGKEVPTWNGEADKTVIVYGEQGVGDEVMFGTILPEVIQRSKHVVFDCHPRLVPLWRRSFPEIEVHGTRKETSISWLKGEYDYSIALGSLPKIFRTKPEDFPHHSGVLKVDPIRKQQLWDRMEAIKPGKPKVGIAWIGGRKKTRFDLRSIPLANWKPILEQDCNFISLQYTAFSAGEAAEHNVPHWQEVIDDMDDQAALIAACDLVISVCQTAVHMAGGLNKECWCLTPNKPAWRYGMTKDYMVWYPDQVRIIRQPAETTWEPVMKDVAQRLQERFK